MPSVSPRPVLVFGASGFLGARVALELALSPRTTAVVGSSRRPPAAGVGLPGAGGLARQWRFEPWDVLARDPRELLESIRPRAVILAAALARASDCASDPERARALNVNLPGEVARWCRSEGVRLVHVSSDLVFGGAPPRSSGYREEDPSAPLSLYGRTKAEGEERVLHADPEALVVRFPLLFGPSGGRGLGASDALSSAIQAGRRPALFRDEWRTPLDVRDAARALIELAHGSTAGLLHVAGPERLSRFELGRMVLAAAGLDPGEIEKRIVSALRADLGLDRERAQDVSLDSARARKLLVTPLRAPADALAPGAA